MFRRHRLNWRKVNFLPSKNVDWEKNCVNPFMFGKYGYTNPFGVCYSFPDFYMIGFSKDGKVAI